MQTIKPCLALMAAEAGRRQRAEGRWINPSEISVLPTALCPLRSADGGRSRARLSGGRFPHETRMMLRNIFRASRCAMLRASG